MTLTDILDTYGCLSAGLFDELRITLAGDNGKHDIDIKGETIGSFTAEECEVKVIEYLKSLGVEINPQPRIVNE